MGCGLRAAITAGSPDRPVEDIDPVETLRLRRIQGPRVERLLDTCISRSNVLPQGFYQIRDSGSVPRELQQILSEAIEQGKVWSCWTDSSDTWLFTCEMSLSLSRVRGTPVLRVNLHDKDGSLKDSAIWATDPQGMWRRFGESAS